MGATFVVKIAHPRLLWVEVTPPPRVIRSFDTFRNVLYTAEILTVGNPGKSGKDMVNSGTGINVSCRPRRNAATIGEIRRKTIRKAFPYVD